MASRRRLRLGGGALGAGLVLIACAACAPVTRPTAEAPGPFRSTAADWSQEALVRAGERAAAAGSDAIIVMDGEKTVWAWGDTVRTYRAHSVRKSLLSALYGTSLARASIDLSQTLAQLGIDEDRQPLSRGESEATIEDLLGSRSGVYRTAAHENAGWDRVRPAPGSHAPGTHFFYSNWDFNVAGLVFQLVTGTNVFEEFERRIADPVGMLDYRSDHGAWRYELERSAHPAYVFRISARDLARFGLLYLAEGRWQGRQVVPAEWIRRSTTSRSDVLHPRTGDPVPGVGYGLHWWVAEGDEGIFGGLDFGRGAFWASGTGEQLLLVSPALRLVIVHRENTDADDDDSVDEDELAEILRLILAARTEAGTGVGG